MFNWIKRLFKAPARKPVVFDYFDGKKQSGIDPVIAYHRLFYTDGIDFPMLLKTYQAPNLPAKDRDEAMFKLMDHAAKSLNLTVFDPVNATQGLTLSDIEDLLVELFDFLDSIKKKRNQQQSLSDGSGSNGSETQTEQSTATFDLD